MGVGRSLVKLAIGTGCVIGGLVFLPLLAGQNIVWGTVLLTALGNVATGNTANAIDALTAGEDPERVSLENEDLTKAVGKAIAAVITLAAKQQQGQTRSQLEKIAAQAKDNWVKIAQQELTQERYPQLREAKLDQFLTPEEYHLTQQGNLTATEWGDIFIRLNMAARQGGGFPIPSAVRQQVEELLHTTFPKALRETLKEDFAKDGKAFAGLTLQLLTGMQAQLRELQISQAGLNAKELGQILPQFLQLETQLRGTEAQQQEFFQQLSQSIDSGFAEVCQQLGVMETHIVELLQGLDVTIERLRRDVEEILSRLDPTNPQLSAAEWGKIAQLMLAERWALTSNPKTGRQGITFNWSDIYVPLGLVERGKREPVIQGPVSERTPQREEEKIIPINEDDFFQQVLQQGNSPQSRGRRIAIIGEAGSGKTTRLQKIADWILQQDLGLPIWIPLAEFTEPTLIDYLEGKWLKVAGVEGATVSLQQQKERLWLLLDGLDEMTARVEGRHLSQLLIGWIQPARVIITCRVNVWEADSNAFSGFDVFRNLPLDVKQVDFFIQSFFSKV